MSEENKHKRILDLEDQHPKLFELKLSLNLDPRT